MKELNAQPGSETSTAAELVHRSFAGPIGNVFAIALLFLSTPLYRDHPLATGLFVTAVAARVVPRAVLALVWRRPDGAPYPQWMIAISAYLLSAPTGLFSAFVVANYGFDSWSSLFILVFALACAIAGASAAAPDRTLVVTFEATLLAPIAAGCFWADHPQAILAGLSFTLFSVYVMIHAIRLNTDYRNATAADRALKARSEELHAAKLAADAASEAKSQFLANMSHEIRTPMNGVLGMLDLVLGTNLSQEQREYLGYARHSADCLLTLLNDLLDHAKAESGKLVLEQIDFAIRPLISDALSPFLVQAGTRGIELAGTVADDVPHSLHGDPTRLRQVLVNLISNAMKFTQTGSIRVTVDVDHTSPGSAFLHFRVADTGPGIPAGKQEAIFEAFSQGDTSITRRFGGTGLGLAICKHLVTMMGGRIWAESQLGRGSTFQFTAGFAVPAEPVAHAQKSASRRELTAVRPLRILVVEDNLINQKLLTRLLTKAGHTCELAGNGEEALSRRADGGFDLVLMDVQMPGMDGLEATRSIRASEASTGVRVPLVGVTAGASAGELEACIAAGMDGCITKPIVINELDEVLKRVSAGQPLTLGTPVSA